MSNRQVCFALIQSSNWEKVIRSSANVPRSPRCRYLPFLFVGIIESNLGSISGHGVNETRIVERFPDNVFLIILLNGFCGSVRKAGCNPCSRFQYYAHNLDSLNTKNGMSATPLNWLLKAFTLALNDSAPALVCLFTKKLSMVS